MGSTAHLQSWSDCAPGKKSTCSTARKTIRAAWPSVCTLRDWAWPPVRTESSLRPSRNRSSIPTPDAQQDREWPGGVEDPRVVEREDGTYVLAYTQWNRRSYDIGIATSTDLIHWQKQGPALQGEKYQHFNYKSASMVTRLTHGRLVAAKINGKYWMYWGEIQVRLATSPDLIHWKPVEDSSRQTYRAVARSPRALR